MISINLYVSSRKIHRFLVLIISVIGLLMAGTGTLLKYTFISKKLTFIDLGLIRSFHNNLSPYFVVVFLGMLITGLAMYLFPMLKNK
ncbi:MAG: hypothetical protein AAB441_01025 [Patescibacteria group bacterium]